MRILLAPDKLKGALTAQQAAQALARGIQKHFPDATLDLLPLSDGGEGFLDTLLAATRGTRLSAEVIGPLPDQRLTVPWGFLGTQPKTAVIESAAVLALSHVPPDRRNPLYTTSFGLGELLLHVQQAGATDVLLGLGGTATMDAGLGLCQAARHTVLRRDGEDVSETDPLAPRDFPDIYMIKTGRGSPLDRLPITVATDVTTRLFADPPAQGCAELFGPQKGATPDDVAYLDQAYRTLARSSHKLDEAATPGSGAAGGLGWALLSFFNATLTPGFDLIAQHTNLRSRIAAADLVLTTEGRFDQTSLHGKAPASLARLCRELGKPCHLLAGQVTTDPSPLFDRAVQLTPADMPYDTALAQTAALLEAKVVDLLR